MCGAEAGYFAWMTTWMLSWRAILLVSMSAGTVTAQGSDSTLGKSAHAKLVCVACHTSLDPRNPVSTRAAGAPVNCLRCHADAQFKHDFHPELAQAIRAGREPHVACTQCHGAHDIAHIGEPGSKFNANRLAESCGKCHQKPAENFPGSAHGAALAAGAKGAPTCLTCHRARITPRSGVADSLTLKANQAALCLTCHLDTPDVRARTAPNTRVVARWDSSKHSVALMHGKANAANCVGCHGSHEIRKASDPASRVNRANVTATCAACHAKERSEFSVSVHGLAKNHAQADSLVCSTCHGEHVAPGAKLDSVPAQICQRCHEPVTLTGTYGLASDRFRGFSDSYHGLTLRGGSFQAANCASCHGAHDVQASKDSTSRVNRVNRAATCGKCHQHAIERFARGPVHDTVRVRTPTPKPAVPSHQIPKP